MFHFSTNNVRKNKKLDFASIISTMKHDENQTFEVLQSSLSYLFFAHFFFNCLISLFQILLFLFSSCHLCLGLQGPTPLPPGYSPTPGTPAPLHLYTPKGYSPFSPTPSPFPEAASPHPPHYATPSPAPYHPPQEYLGHCDARVAPYCANVTGLHYCLEDPQYPEYDIKLAISQDYLFEKKYSDVVDQSSNDLVESIPAKQVQILSLK